ncbi:MAG: SpoIIE family protein phosphatase [Ruminococcus sp.]|nr:SpoIIE family protein phosphatase [Ruminococcus sp.]
MKASNNRLSDESIKLLDNNEHRMNLIVTAILIIADVLMIIQVITNPAKAYIIVFCGVPAVLLTPVIIMNLIFCKRLHHWVKNVNMAVIIISFMLIAELNSNEFQMLFILPAFISSFYYDPRYTLASSGFSVATLWMVMFNNVQISRETQINDLKFDELLSVLFGAFDFSKVGELADLEQICKFAFSALMIGIAIYISYSGRLLYTRQAELLSEKASAKAELTMARDIQKGALCHEFPDNSSFSVYGDMEPAYAVGGDFYDQFEIDDTHLAVVVGDVSGHGMAAAMIMMLSMTLIKVYAQSGLSCDKVILRANKYLVSANPQKFFVTCWLGILDLTSGELCYVNAGHNYPVLLRKGQAPEYLKEKSDFVLGRRRLARYNEKHLKLNAGDKLVLYTDGVTESVSPQDEFFGDERLLRTVSASADTSAKQLVFNIKQAVSDFSGNKMSSDDITVETLEFKGLMPIPEYENKTFFLTMQSFDTVLDYIEERCKEYGCSMDIVYDILTASSEILANIESYAYENGGDVQIMTISNRRKVTIVFKDKGKAFDPMLVIKPDVTLPLSQRRQGGLGIHIVKKLMDSSSYRYEDGQNILTIEKDF